MSTPPNNYRELLIQFIFNASVPTEVTLKMMRELRRLDNERNKDETE